MMPSNARSVPSTRPPNAAAESSPPSAPTRRELLKSTGLLTGTLALSSLLAGLAPGRAWALDLGTFSSHQGAVILAFSRHLYPHPTLDDAVYALVVKDLDSQAASDHAVQQIVLSGVRQLDQIGGGDWLKRPPALQLVDVESMQDTPFFVTVRSTAVVALYNNDMAFAHFGYGGKDGHLGYLHKGFNDLKWLPEPPDAASGPIPQD